MPTIYTLRLTADSLDTIEAALAGVKRPSDAAADAKFVREIVQEQRAASDAPYQRSSAPAPQVQTVDDAQPEPEPDRKPSRRLTAVALDLADEVEPKGSRGTRKRKAVDVVEAPSVDAVEVPETPVKRRATKTTPTVAATAPAPAAAAPKQRTARKAPAAAPAVEVDRSPAAVRAWARQNGYTLGDRGRLPSEVLQRYAAEVG